MITPPVPAEVRIPAPAPTATSAPSRETVRFCAMEIPIGATELACDGEGIVDIAPLARLTALEKLSLRFTRVTDLSPLAGLTALRELEITGCRTEDERHVYGCPGDEKPDPRTGYLPPLMVVPLTDVSPLAGLSRLESVHLDSTRVADITPLARLPKLRELTVAWTQVKRVPPLAKTLETFLAEVAPIEDIDGLRDLPALAVVRLSQCRVPSLEALEHDTRLRELHFWPSFPQLTSLHGLESLAALTTLELMNLDAVALGPLAGKPHLKWLYIKYASVTGLKVLADLTGLEHLTLDAWDATPRHRGGLDLQPIGSLTALRELDLGGDPGSLAPLARLTNLEAVSLHGDTRNWARFDLAPLAQAKRLTSLHIDEGEPTRLGDLGALTALESLDLNNASGAPLAALGKLTRLKHLHVDHQGVLDARVFESLTHLDSLQFEATDVTSLGSIGTLASLRTLVLDVKKPLVVDPLAALTGLHTLDLGRTPVATLSALDKLTELRSFATASPALTDVSVVAQWPHLEKVKLGNAPGLHSVEPLRGLAQLADVELDSVPVSDAAPIAALPALRRLFLSGTAVRREDEIPILLRIGGCHHATCSAWPALRKSYRHTFK